MQSTLTWLDFSESDRRRVVELVNQFDQGDTRDELGIAAIRDTFSDQLFPGTSTIQTRARYFLFVPWIYLDAEHERIESCEVFDFVRDQEIDLINALIADPGTTSGVIGQIARANLDRFPSNIYWSGLRRWGIRLFDRSQEDYHRWLDRYYERADGEHDALQGFEQPEERCEGHSGAGANWHAYLPPPPEGFPEEASLQLTSQEAAYLAERVRLECPGSLLEWLLSRAVRAGSVDTPWAHPSLHAFPPSVRDWLDHGRCFSELMQGAALLYNLVLAECPGCEEDPEPYRAALDHWWDRLDGGGSLRGWDRDGFWALLDGARSYTIDFRTRVFVDAWRRLVESAASVEDLVNGSAARQLIIDRESKLKPGRARYNNASLLAVWRGNSGTRALTYRWGVARDIINDIVDALPSAEGAADAESE